MVLNPGSSSIYSRIWQGCDVLRGGMDASQYKDYVLSILFIKYVSDKYAGQPYGAIKVPVAPASRTWWP
jgi:type I restriction enzyme M protein